MSDKPKKDTLFADVSEFQVPVNNSYPYDVLSIRVCDGSYRDGNFEQNYSWMQDALDDDDLVFGIVYTFVRPNNWADNAATVKDMIDANGGLHDRVCIMLDVETESGNPNYDVSDSINKLYDNLAEWIGDRKRLIGYGNSGDLDTCWPDKPDDIRLIVAGYGTLPDYPGMVAHQYTDGQGYGNGLPEGCDPFGNCDMNAANDLTPKQFAKECGITAKSGDSGSGKDKGKGSKMPLNDEEQRELFDKVRVIFDAVQDNQLQLRGPDLEGWDQLNGRTLVDTVADLADCIEGVTNEESGDSV